MRTVKGQLTPITALSLFVCALVYIVVVIPLINQAIGSSLSTITGTYAPIIIILIELAPATFGFVLFFNIINSANPSYGGGN